MANPFDDVINMEEDKKTVKLDKSKDVISFSVNKRMVERGTYIAIILILGGLLFINPWNSVCNFDNDEGISAVTGNVILEDTDEANNEEPEVKAVLANSAESEDSNTEITVTSENEPAEITSDEGETHFAGNFVFKITDIDAEAYEGSDTPRRMKSITFVMENRWRDLEPRIEVYWFDPDDNEIFKTEKTRAILTPKMIAKGKKQTIVANKFDSTFVNPTNDIETVMLKLFDDDTGEQLAYAKQNIGT